MFKYFGGCTSFDDVKTRWKEHVKKLHPDRGGTHEGFVAMQGEFESIKSRGAYISYPLPDKAGTNNKYKAGWDEPFAGFAGFEEAFKRAAREQEEASRQRRTKEDFRQAEEFARKQRQKREEQARAERERDKAAKEREQAEREEARRKSYGFGPGFTSNVEDDFDNYYHNPYANKQGFQQDNRFNGFSSENGKQRGYSSERSKWDQKETTDPDYDHIRTIFNDCITSNRSATYMLLEVYKLGDLDMEHFKYISFLFNTNGNTNLGQRWVEDAYRNYVSINKIKWDMA